MSVSCKVISVQVMPINYTVMSVNSLFIVQYMAVTCTVIVHYMRSIHPLRGRIVKAKKSYANAQHRMRLILNFFICCISVSPV